MKKKLLASVSLDLDNQWSYMKTHGDPEWASYPSYYPIVIPTLLTIFEELDLKVTFFIVGKDATFKTNHAYLKLLASKGHRIGNHSFNHEVWLPYLGYEEMKQDIENAEEAIFNATGIKPVGFRGPGFAWSSILLNLLIEKGYAFDASTLPTFIGPLARIYYFLTSNFTTEERKKRNTLFGSFKDGFRPIKPYFWNINDKKILEVPVTTMPVFRIPFHVSYLLYLSRFSKSLMLMYLNLSILLCRFTRTQPSILLHPLDIIGVEDIPELSFFPGMDIGTARKVELFKLIMNKFKKHFNLVTMDDHVREIIAKNKIRDIMIK